MGWQILVNFIPRLWLAYAFTLLGHEYVFTEELDKAMSCFRNAIRVDPRHYN
jgi:anaphase-promoting complex subunit 3